MWRNFRFLHICHAYKFEISPHGKFFSTYLICDICDKYHVCLDYINIFANLRCSRSFGVWWCHATTWLALLPNLIITFFTWAGSAVIMTFCPVSLEIRQKLIGKKRTEGKKCRQTETTAGRGGLLLNKWPAAIFFIRPSCNNRWQTRTLSAGKPKRNK